MLLTGCAARLAPVPAAAPCTLATLATELPVARIIDGDTLVLEGGERIRLLGIDAPELRQPGGAAARAFLVALAEGKIVRIERRGHDRYARTLAHLYLPDGRSLAALLLTAGHARPYLPSK